MHKGSCLCGAVRIVVEGELPQPHGLPTGVACRKQTGHYEASIDIPRKPGSHRGRRGGALVSILGKSAARILRHLWIDPVLGSGIS